ncbi:hypothetical protein CLOM_g14608 [Closterium sp. NIES-68]|nr:hypothetical protein CLOM_g14608 [Closterium sp. NIES-68]GJP82451.1 hypothetical protein CLOP_g12710 [Closterium sp. NIES-67]
MFRASAALLLVVASLVASPVHSRAAAIPRNFIHNGNFESPGSKDISAPIISAEGGADQPAPALEGWEVKEGSIKYVRSDTWRAAEGAYSVALNGAGPGVLSQVVTTEEDALYVLTFALSADPCGINDLHALNVSVVAANTDVIAERTLEADALGTAGGAMSWRVERVAFEAQVGPTRVVFRSLSPGECGPVVDNVRLVKQDAVSLFFKSPNTAYPAGTIISVQSPTGVEGCARHCIAVRDCVGFAVDLQHQLAALLNGGPLVSAGEGGSGGGSGGGNGGGGAGGGAVQCDLKRRMVKPAPVGPYVADAYVLRGAPCSFSGHEPAVCPHILPLPGLTPLACVASHHVRRSPAHPFTGTCRPMQRTAMCPLGGGFFRRGALFHAPHRLALSGPISRSSAAAVAAFLGAGIAVSAQTPGAVIAAVTDGRQQQQQPNEQQQQEGSAPAAAGVAAESREAGMEVPLESVTSSASSASSASAAAASSLAPMLPSRVCACEPGHGGIAVLRCWQ